MVKLIQPYCVYGICFSNAPKLIDSFVQQSNYTGLLLKIYDLRFGSTEKKMSDSLIKRGFKKFPIDWHGIPMRLKGYINLEDSGFYKDMQIGGESWLILDYTTSKLISYNFGFLREIYLTDSLAGKIR